MGALQNGHLEVLQAQHARLRLEVDAACAAARRLMASGKGAGDLQMAIAKVERDLLEHLDDEEQILEPALEADEAAGSLRARLLEAEHAHQRAVLSILSTPMAWPADKVLAERTLEFCADLLGDIDFEDRELLGPCMPAARA